MGNPGKEQKYFILSKHFMYQNTKSTYSSTSMFKSISVFRYVPAGPDSPGFQQADKYNCRRRNLYFENSNIIFAESFKHLLCPAL